MKRLVAGLVAGTLLIGSTGAVLAKSATNGHSAGSALWSQMHSGGSGMMGGGTNTMMGNGGTHGTMGSGGSGGMMNGAQCGGLMASYGSSAMMGTGGMMGGWQQSTPQGKALTLAQAQQRVQQYLTRYSNPKLAIDEVMEFQNNFYAIVKDTSTGKGAFEVLVNKVTGVVFPEYGPAMMWNTVYGMHGTMGPMMGYQQPSGPMTVSAMKAQQIARQWLAQHQPGSTTEAPDQFPGYYTLHILKGGKVTGMLSVNGYSGQVWYHTWHGTFIRLVEVQG
jgi:hypothetical protein